MAEGWEELLDLGGPAGARVAAGEFGVEGGGPGVQLAALESVAGPEAERLGEAFGELLFFKAGTEALPPPPFSF